MNKQLLIDKLIENNLDIEIFDVIDSTNNYSRANLANYSRNQLIVASMQTDAVGRYDRTFLSMEDCGLYFSLVLKNSENKYYTQKLTMLCAVAVKEAISNLYDLDVKIKWINDLFFNGKKTGGILINKVNNDYIIGIGLNLYDFDNLNKLNATYLFEYPIIKEELLAEIINKIFYYLNDDKLIHNLYRKYSLIYHRHVKIEYKNKIIDTYVDDILDNGDLVVVIDGQSKVYKSSEIRIRME